jgi:hypothetical protein
MVDSMTKHGLDLYEPDHCVYTLHITRLSCIETLVIQILNRGPRAKKTTIVKATCPSQTHVSCCPYEVSILLLSHPL